jgi:hypothetical protein
MREGYQVGMRRSKQADTEEQGRNSEQSMGPAGFQPLLCHKLLSDLEVPRILTASVFPAVKWCG